MVIVPVVAETEAEVDPEATVTEAGTLRTEFELESLTESPPLGAAGFTETVHVAVAFDPRLDGVHERVKEVLLLAKTVDRRNAKESRIMPFKNC